MARSQRTSNPVTLFPFLAVLLCTIGVLVLLLVVVSAGIRKDAVATAKQKSAAESLAHSKPAVSELAAANPKVAASVVVAQELTSEQKPIEPLLVRDSLLSPIKEAPPRTLAEIADLENVARKLEAEVTSRAKQLSSVSVKTYALRKQLRTVKAQQTDLQLQIIRTANQRVKLEESTGELRVENQQIIEWLDESRKLIDEHKNQLVSPVHSIVPYDGQTGTVRRPVIIECVGDVVRFEVEQVEIPVAILQKFSPEQNPLASGVQALFRYWMAKEQISDPGRRPRKPYALILVRPSGAEAFSSAVFAMDRMVGDFGYELVETDFLYEVPETTADAMRECRAAVEAEIRRGPIRARRTLNPQGPIDIARVTHGPAASRGFFRSADFRNRRAVGAGGDGTGGGTGDPAADGGSARGAGEENVGAAVAKAAARRREADLKAAVDRARNLLKGRGAEAASLLEKGPPSSFDEALAAVLAEAARSGRAGAFDLNGQARTFVQERDSPPEAGSLESSPFLQPSQSRPGIETRNRPGVDSSFDGKNEAKTGNQNLRNANGQPRWLADTDGRPVVGAGSPKGGAGEENGRQRNSAGAGRPSGGATSGNGPGESGSGSGRNRLGEESGRSGASRQPSSESAERSAASPHGTSARRTFRESSSATGEPGSSQSSNSSASASGRQSSADTAGSQSSPISSGGPTISARPRSNQVRSLKTQKRWGRSHPDASLGLEKVVEVRVESGRIVVGNQFQVTRTAERSEADIVKRTIQTIEHLANQWGLPSPRFYWVPSVSLVSEPAEQRLGTLLEAAVEDAGAALE
jgi:hypothetical protein